MISFSRSLTTGPHTMVSAWRACLVWGFGDGMRTIHVLGGFLAPGPGVRVPVAAGADGASVAFCSPQGGGGEGAGEEST